MKRSNSVIQKTMSRFPVLLLMTVVGAVAVQLAPGCRANGRMAADQYSAASRVSSAGAEAYRPA